MGLMSKMPEDEISSSLPEDENYSSQQPYTPVGVLAPPPDVAALPPEEQFHPVPSYSHQTQQSLLEPEAYGPPPPSPVSALPAPPRQEEDIYGVNSPLRTQTSYKVKARHGESPYTATAQALEEKAFSEEEKANEMSAKAESDALKAKSALYEDARLSEGIRGRIAQDAMDSDRSREEAQAARVRQAIDAANKEIDPNRAFKNKSTISKISLLLGAGLGGFVSGYYGKPDHGMDTINSIIDDDISAQKADMANRQHQVGQEQGLYATYKQMGMSNRLAEAAAKESAWKQVEMSANALAAKTDDPIVAARYAKIGAAITARRADAKKGTDILTFQPEHTGTVGLSVKDQLAIREFGLKRSEVGIKQQEADTKRAEVVSKETEKRFERAREDMARTIPGWGMTATPAEKEKFVRNIAGASTVKSTIDRMIPLISNSTRTPSDDRAIHTMAEKLIPYMAEAQGNTTGRFSEGTVRLAKDIMQDPDRFFTRIWSAPDIAALNTLRDEVSENLVNEAKAIGIQKAHVEWVPYNGGVQPVPVGEQGFRAGAGGKELPKPTLP